MSLLERLDEFLERLRVRYFESWQDNAEFVQSILGLLRLILLAATLVMFILLGAELFEDFGQINAFGRAQIIRQTNPFFSGVPLWILAGVVFLIDPHTIRYSVAPLLAIAMILMSGSTFVASVYDIEWSDALRYILASLFGVGYQKVIIDGGEMRPPVRGTNLLDRIGGPGYALIQPGNAVLFRWLRKPSNVSIASSYFMSPFERFGVVANLDEQHGHVEEVTTLTRDGIRLSLKDVHFRYQILPEIRNGQPVRRTMQDPFPVSVEAIETIANNLPVDENGFDPWRRAVQRVTISIITAYINAHTLDFLTAPREKDQDPRLRIQEDLFSEDSRIALADLGASLLWVDLGHFDIQEEMIDRKRLDLWAAGLRGEADAERAVGEAKMLAYRELGRAEAQAELVASIAHALEDIDLSEKDPARVRKLLLVRAAQAIDAISQDGSGAAE